jgi:hypothetical protein
VPRDDGGQHHRTGASASIAATPVRAEKTMAPHRALARGLRVAEQATVTHEPSSTAAMITRPELRAGDCCAEPDLIRDEPPRDGTEVPSGWESSRRPHSRLRPRSSCPRAP